MSWNAVGGDHSHGLSTESFRVEGACPPCWEAGRMGLEMKPLTSTRITAPRAKSQVTAEAPGVLRRSLSRAQAFAGQGGGAPTPTPQGAC